MHVMPTMPPQLSYSQDLSSESDFSVSPFLLLPDSFGDIYTGELFSAYIAVVNGNQDAVFNQVTLSVRLQTANAMQDLSDCYPNKNSNLEQSGSVAVLNINESVDVVVKHTLTELGTHTLRVSVQYFNQNSNEPKILRKFYRFNVLEPLRIVSTAVDLGSTYAVQSVVTNKRKSPLYLEEVFVYCYWICIT